jgi:hypothetical protein
MLSNFLWLVFVNPLLRDARPFCRALMAGFAGLGFLGFLVPKQPLPKRGPRWRRESINVSPLHPGPEGSRVKAPDGLSCARPAPGPFVTARRPPPEHCRRSPPRRPAPALPRYPGPEGCWRGMPIARARLFKYLYVRQGLKKRGYVAAGAIQTQIPV